MLAIALLALVVVVQEAGAKVEKKADPKLAISAIVKEVSDMYTSAGKELRSKKTSADRTDFVDSVQKKAKDWAAGKVDIDYVCDTRVHNIVKNTTTGVYYLIAPVGKDLLPWARPGRVVLSVPAFQIPIEDDEMRSKLVPKQAIRIAGKLNVNFEHHASLVLDKTGRTPSLDFPKVSTPDHILFSVSLDRSAIAGSDIVESREFATFYLDVESIEVIK